jgi:hypothetical protein
MLDVVVLQTSTEPQALSWLKEVGIGPNVQSETVADMARTVWLMSR